MKYRHRKIVLILYFFIASECYAQNISGKIIDNKDNPIAYANVVLKSVVDSVVLDGTITDDKGLFLFKKQYNMPIIIEVSYVGYITWSKKIYESSIPVITIISDTKQIEEIFVVGKKQKVIENKHGVLSVNVAKSFLKNETDVYSLLSKVPGIKVGNENIALFGKDHLAVYIDDRKVLSSEEYNMLKPSDILHIEVIRNPGAEYDANNDAVLKIYTNRNSFIRTSNLTLTNKISINHGIANSLSATISHSRESISQTFNYNYGYSSGSEQTDVIHTYNYLPTYTNLSIRNIILKNNMFRHSFFYGLSLLFSKKVEFGLQYVGYIRETKKNIDGELDVFHNEIETFSERLYENDHIENQLHNFSLNFKYKITPKLRFVFVGDYAYAYYKTLNLVEENLEGVASIINENNSKNKYHIFSADPRFTYSEQNLRITSGIKISYMKNKSSIWYGSNNSDDSIRLTDLVSAVYAQAAIKTNLVDLKIGMRGEWAESKQYSNLRDDVSKVYKDVFPYFSLEKKIGKGLNFTLSYRKSINRPSIDQLDPTYIYRDTLTYQSGNPNLKPETSDMFDLSVEYKSFGLEIGYYCYKDTYYIFDIQDQNNPDVVNSTYGNLDKINRVVHAGLTHNYSYKMLSTMVSVMMDKPYTQVPFLGHYISKNKALWYLQTQVNASVLKWLSFSAAYSYNSNGDYKDMSFQEYSSFDLGLKLYLLNKSLLVSVSVDDIFHANYSNSWSSKKNNIRYEMYSIPDSRIFSFSVRYMFGKGDKEVLQTSSSNEIRGRLN